jgi:hypothetical protein
MKTTKMTTKKRDPEEWYSAIQYVDAFPTERESDEAVLALSQLDGFLAGRTIAPSPAKPGWRAQAFFENTSGGQLPRMGGVPSSGTVLPDSLRLVMVRDSMLAALVRRE